MKLHLLVENVLLQKSTDLEWFNRALDAKTFAADAASFGMIKRPRAWWSRIDWTNFSNTTQNTYWPGRPLKWDKLEERLRPGVKHDDPASFSMPGLRFHDEVASR